MRNLSKGAVIGIIVVLCLLLAAAVAFLVNMELNTVPRPELYRNLDGHLYSRNTQTRTPSEDGLYHLRFGYEDLTVDLPVADLTLVNYIDTMDTMGLTISEEGLVTDAFPVETVGTVICENTFIKKTTGDTVMVNTSLAMNGMDTQFLRNKKTRFYDITKGSVVEVLPGALRPMDGICAYGDEKGNVTHIYITSHPTESSIYWRTARMYSSSTKETTRQCDENGLYSIDFYCDGKIVSLQCKDKALVTQIDQESGTPHFGLTFDKDGLIQSIVNPSLALRGIIICDGYDVTEVTPRSFVTEKKISSKGETWAGDIAIGCQYYDISPAAQAEDRMGEEVSELQVGDRVTVWTDTENRAILVYITNRLVDAPIYYNVTRKYDSDSNVTTRKKDENGWYTAEVIKAGETEITVLKTEDKAIMSKLDKESSRCIGIVADEEGVIQNVYPPQSLFGHSAWSSGGVVSSVTGTIVTRIPYGKPTSATNAVMLPDCQVYNVSTDGQYGATTTLQKGDYIYAFRQPSGELVHIYVVRRTLGADTMYFNLDRQYDTEAKESTRKPDSDGIYTFTLAHQGKNVTLKVDNKEMADLLDSFSPGAVSLRVEEDRITAVNDPKYACGGSQVANGYVYKGINEKGKHVAQGSDKETTFTMAEDCVIYDTKNGGYALSQIPEGRKITVYTDMNGNAQIIFLR